MTTMPDSGPHDDFGQYLTVLPGWQQFVASTTSTAMTVLTKNE